MKLQKNSYLYVPAIALAIMAGPGTASAGDGFNLMGDRLDAVRTGDNNFLCETGMAAGNLPKGLAAWAQVQAQSIHQDNRDGVAGYNADGGGVTIGADSRAILEHSILGAAFTYNRIDANGKDVNTTGTDVDSYQLSLYGSYDAGQHYYLNAMGGYVWDNLDTVRHNVQNSGFTADASFNAHALTGALEAGRDLMYQGVLLNPHLMIHGVSYDQDAYTETNAGPFSLRVNGAHKDLLEIGGGLRARWSFKQRDGSWLKPSLHGGYSYAVADSEVDETANFTGGGAPFIAAGMSPARSNINLGAGVKYYSTRNWQFSADYDFNWREDYTAHSGYLRAAYRF